MSAWRFLPIFGRMVGLASFVFAARVLIDYFSGSDLDIPVAIFLGLSMGLILSAEDFGRAMKNEQRPVAGNEKVGNGGP